MKVRRLLLLSLLGLAACGADSEFWTTRPRQGQLLCDEGRFAEAAERFQDPMRRGAALYRAGRFEEAAQAWLAAGSAEGFFNRGNAQLMGGLYQEAMQSYERALSLRPDWPEAEENRALAEARWKKRNPDVDDAGGTGGKLEADEIVFGDRASKSTSPPETIDVQEGGGDDEAMRALWLRNVRTRPADFLRAKFAYQASKKE